jgi:predicted metallopeptidase
MRKSVINSVTIAANILVAIGIISATTATVVYAQNTSTIQAADHTNTANTMTLIKKLNPTFIIEAINAKIKSVYSDDEKLTNPTTSIITKVKHEQTN